MLATLSPIELCVLGSIVPITVSDRAVDDTPESQPVFLGIFNGKSMIFVLKMLLAPAYRWETMENIAGQCFRTLTNRTMSRRVSEPTGRVLQPIPVPNLKNANVKMAVRSTTVSTSARLSVKGLAPD